MDERKMRRGAGVVIILVIVGAAVWLRFFSPSIYDSILTNTSRAAALYLVGLQQLELKFQSEPNGNAVSQSDVLEITASGSQSNVLELPRASLDFVGVWGAYTHTTVYSGTLGALAAKGPDRISVVFARQGDTVVVASELYTPPNQRIIGRPRARMSSPTEALIEYKAKDPKLYYVYLHRFKLLGSGKIAYSGKVDMYDRRTHAWVGMATQHALLKQLTTLDERRKFAIPSPLEVSSGEVSADRSFDISGTRDSAR